MSGRWTALLVAGALLASKLPTCGAADKDETRIQGQWTTERFVWSGRESGQGEEMAVAIDGESLSWTYERRTGDTGTAGTIKFTYNLDPSKNPAEIDLVATEGQFRGKMFPSIYRLDGDTLKICRAQPGQIRPPEFSSEKGSDDILLILKRSK